MKMIDPGGLVLLLREQGMTLASAESCTGGLFGAMVTEVSGSSAVYKGGVISYTNAVKCDVLGVEQSLLDTCGAVSAQVAEAMARGTRYRLGADLGVSVTGLAGPKGDGSGKPIGLVYIAVSTEGETSFRELHLTGDRTAIRKEACRQMLLFLEEVLSQGKHN